MAAGDLRLEVWRRPGAAVFERLVEQIPGPFNFTKRMAGGVGQGDITVPATWDRINDVITRIPGTPSSDVRTLNRVLMEQASGAALVKYEWFNDVTGDESREDFTQIQGAGIESIMADGIVYPWDWDGLDQSTSTFPDWIWGGKDVVGPLLTTYAPHVFDAWIDTGATGTFGIDIDLDGGGFQSASVAPGDSAFDVEQAIEGLGYGITADVQGNGTEESPWRISLMDPAGTFTVAIDSGGLSGGRGFLTIQEYGAIMPIGWTPSRVGSTIIGHGILTDFRASLGGGADPVLPAGCDAWIVFLGQEWFFPGVQKRIRVTAGAPFQIPDDYIQLYAQGANADVRLIVRDMNEQEICSVELSLVSNTVTPVPGFTCMIPVGITEVIFRLGHIGEGTPPRIFMACPSMREGLAPTTAGGIMEALMDDATVDHVADGRVVWENLASAGTTYLNSTFSVALDSDGVAWDEDELTFTAQRGKTYLQVLTDLNHLGYKWTVTASTPGVWNLNLYNPTWIDTDATALATPAINIGSGVTGGPIFRSHMTGNVITVEGSQMQFGRSESATSVTSIGRREAYQPDRSLLNNQMASLRAAEEVASRLLSGLSVAVTVDPVTGPIPLLDYDVDWQLNVQIPPIVQKSAHRLASITVSVGEITQYKLAFSSESFAGVQGVIEGVRRLMLKFEGLERPVNEDIPVALTGGGGMPTIVVAASDATEYSKRKADFICSGVDDQVVIRRGVSEAGYWGRVQLTEGTYYCTADIDPMVDMSNTIEGMGFATYVTISGGAVDGDGFRLNDYSVLKNLWIEYTGSQSTFRIVHAAGGALILDYLKLDHTGGSCFGIFAELGFEQSWMRNCAISTGIGIDIDGGEGVVIEGMYMECGDHAIRNTGVSGDNMVIANSYLLSDNTAVELTNLTRVRMYGNYIQSPNGHGIDIEAGSGVFSGNWIVLPGDVGVLLRSMANNDNWVVTSNKIYRAGQHGIHLSGSGYCIVSNNRIEEPGRNGDNTYDGIHLSGDADRNSIQDNTIMASPDPTEDARYGINVSAATCDYNVVNGNVIGPLVDFGTGDINDAGTGTMIGTNFSA